MTDKLTNIRTEKEVKRFYAEIALNHDLTIGRGPMKDDGSPSKLLEAIASGRFTVGNVIVIPITPASQENGQ